MSAADVPSHRLKRAKRALRRSVIERRDRIKAAERRDLSRRIADRLLALTEVRDAGTVMAFWSFGSEVDTAPLIERLHAAGARVVLPRVEGDEIVAVAFAPGDPATPTRFGVLEPSGTDVVDPGDVDVVVTPGVAFDRRGRRVGYGGGFYDRFLPRTRPGVPAIAVAFGLQVVDEAPEGRADHPVDAIVTEDEVIRCQPR
ncbi:MAG: 5-formyltetrahydrofolate cyclo-ligase [Actinomycetota bacterium]